MSKEEIISEIKSEYSQLTSLDVYESEAGCIVLRCPIYRGSNGCVSLSQAEYIKDLKVLGSKNNIRRMNKWVASAVINIAKKYKDEDVEFFAFAGKKL